MEKVKSGKYKRFREYELFVFTDTWLYEDLLREGIIFFESTLVFNYFKRIYILEKECKLHIFEKNIMKWLILIYMSNQNVILGRGGW